ncbi:imidazole glycerol phosphate synthase subunit HisH [Sulfoacidibacillus thermotolerans]|uniref:Imidazole glycerol phosphate synthase subunit HisH n=1 Tax=Sulfoacidibacillus thermotolerans TaxID=1765684 RepID=A0A2U3D8M6_SULT2|nr:imidazole glycerol phosphate synthase subunit HisH [Sulfoacidibacillus thermotolerans]PWI57633.1 imidazole glycerol phosphate synthase subunit HisH [Sulfoacidibacillus thermotolerans]
MIAIVDYGLGNLRSVENAFHYLQVPVYTTSDASEMERADGVILPGVGAFGDAMEQLHRRDLVKPLQQYARSGKPLLGICLGMQLLFEVSDEHGEHEGLGLLAGRVTRMQGDYKIPHVGWNQLQLHAQHPLVTHIQTGDYVYFVHSYYVVPQNKEMMIATADYHQAVPAIVASQQVYGMQFHPERSSKIGLQLLRNFAQSVALHMKR